MNMKSHDRGFTIKKAVERIREREDNTFTKKAISGILKMYAEECQDTLLNGGKVSIKGVGTIRPSLVDYKHCGLPTVDDGEDYSCKIVRMNFHTNDIFKDMLKERLNENMENGIIGLELEDDGEEE